MPSPSGTSSFSKRARSYSRPQTPTQRSSIYNPSPSRAKPKVLPFPDLSVRALSRDASRTTSPTDTPPLTISPRGSQSGSTIGLASLGMEVTASGSGYFGSRTDLAPLGTETSTPGSEEGQRPSFNAGSSSSITFDTAINSVSVGTSANTPSGSGTTTPRSPLGRPSFSIANLPIPPHPNRMRSFTTPDEMHYQARPTSLSPPASAAARASTSGPPATNVASSSSAVPPQQTPPSILLNPIVTSAAPTTRIEGFNPVPLSPTTTIRASSSVPTNIHITHPSHTSATASTSTTSNSGANVTATAAATTLPSTPLPKDSPLPSSSTQHDKRSYTSITPVRKMDGELSEHLHRSFQEGLCADVRVWVRKWGVGWPLHKMILVQTGFFHSMFMGGFSETGRQSSRKGKERLVWDDNDGWTGEVIELQFDDPNITRAAFEICLSRLYSIYPHLAFPDCLVATLDHPLTPAYTAMDDKSHEFNTNLRGDGRFYVTSPRLLLSLLATTIYLGQADLMKEVMTMILRTVGPWTINRYLSFAVGEGLGEVEWPTQADEPAYGMHRAARSCHVEEDEEDAAPNSRRPWSARSSTDSTSSNTKVEDDEQILRDAGRSRRTSRPSPLSFGDSPSSTSQLEDSTEDDEIEAQLPHFYGFASDKIGEACCCFLTRWGLDILKREVAFDKSTETNAQPPWRVFAYGGLHAKFIRALLSSDQLFVRDEMDRYKAARKVLDLRRREWEEDASGDLGVSPQTELDSEDEEEEDEVELGKVFTDGIYYTHMTFDDLSTIAADVDPQTALPYAPLNVLQAAHWSAADLKSRILAAAAAELPEPELGLSKTVSELMTSASRRRRGRSSRNVTPSTQSGSRSSFSVDHGPSSSTSISSVFSDLPIAPGTMYHPIPTDDTHRIGAAGLMFHDIGRNGGGPLAVLPGMPDLGPAAETLPNLLEQINPRALAVDAPDIKVKARPQPHGEKTYFGLSRSCRLLSDLVSSHPHSSTSAVDTKWSKVEPFRFSVEFWDVHALIERERTYSTTHFFAGSWFNVYVQTVRKEKRGNQLGVYIHRQSPAEPFPPPSVPGGVNCSVPGAVNFVNGTVSGSRSGGSTGFTGGVPLGRSVTGQVTVGSPRAGELTGTDEELSQQLKRNEDYRDERPITRAYFSITCASALGTALIRFSSAPDNFTLSQSWGWKSNALRSAEYLSGGPDLGTHEGYKEATEGMLERGVLGWEGDVDAIPKGGSLRASVVVGLI